jgi:hypothetical protein
MAHNVVYSIVLNQLKLAAIVTDVGNAGLLKIYDGTQPASPDTAISTQVLLSTHTCGTSFAGASSSAHPSVLTANAIGSATAGNTSTASWFRITTSGGTAHVDGTAGVGSGFDLNLNSTSITSGQNVAINSCTVTSAT